jgi:hypothetical protein
MLHSKISCPKVRAIKQEKVIKLIRNHRIAVEQKMFEIRQQEKEMMKSLVEIMFDDKIKEGEDYEEKADKIDFIHG